MAKSVFLFGIVSFLAMSFTATDSVWGDQPGLRSQANKEKQQGNFKDAYEKFVRLCKDPETDPKLISQDVSGAVECLQRLGEIKKLDELLEETVGVHGENWRLLEAAARQYMNTDHRGYLIGGKFERGPHRGGGKVVNSFARDRVRGLQLLDQAQGFAVLDDDKGEVASFFARMADTLAGQRGGNGAWRLQHLTDLSELPDYEEGYYYGGSNQGAPVDAENNPVVYSVPDSWDAAVNDGERWRWALEQIAENQASRLNEVRYKLAQFAQAQFSVATMQQFGWFRPRRGGEDDNQPRTYDLHTLTDKETIARLATGIRRFELPAEYNYLEIYKTIIAEPRGGYAEQALQALSQIYENRRQYPQAAERWRENIEKFGAGNRNWKQDRLDQIVKNWGTIEPTSAQPAGTNPTFEYKFRNGGQVDLKATRLDISQVIDDLKDYLKSNPKRLDWSQINIPNIGYRIVNEKQEKYLVGKPIEWSKELDPAKKNHLELLGQRNAHTKKPAVDIQPPVDR